MNFQKFYEEKKDCRNVYSVAYLFLLHLLFHGDGFFLVFASLVLEPYPDDTRTKSGHFDELFLHKSVWPWIRSVARSQSVQLFLI